VPDPSISQAKISSSLNPITIEEEVIPSSSSSEQHRLVRVHFHTEDPSSVRDFAKEETLYSHRVSSLASPFPVLPPIDDLPSSTTKCGIIFTTDSSLPYQCVDSWKSRLIVRTTTPKIFTEADDLELRDKIRRDEISIAASSFTKPDVTINKVLSKYSEVLILDLSGEVVSHSSITSLSAKNVSVFRTRDPMHPSGFLVCYAHWLAAKGNVFLLVYHLSLSLSLSLSHTHTHTHTHIPTGMSASSISTRLSQILSLPTTFAVGIMDGSSTDRVLGRKTKKNKNKNSNKTTVLTATFDGSGGSNIKSQKMVNDIPSAFRLLNENARQQFLTLQKKGKNKIRPRYRHDGAHAGKKAGQSAADRYNVLLRDGTCVVFFFTHTHTHTHKTGVEYDCMISYDRLCPHLGDDVAKSLREDKDIRLRHIYLAPDSSLPTVSMYGTDCIRVFFWRSNIMNLSLGLIGASNISSAIARTRRALRVVCSGGPKMVQLALARKRQREKKIAKRSVCVLWSKNAPPSFSDSSPKVGVGLCC